MHAQSYGLDTEDLERTPGGFDDPIRLIQSLPGAVGTREYGPMPVLLSYAVRRQRKVVCILME